MSGERTLVLATPRIPPEAVAEGVSLRRLAPADDQDRCSTSLVELAAGAELPGPPLGDDRELFVLEGECSLGELGALRAGDHAWQPADRVGACSTEAGCTLFLKEGPDPRAGAGDRAPTVTRASAEPWLPGQGNLRVKPLRSTPASGTALVHWPPGERFVPHRHLGGEEILVLSGTFIDEHGRYPAGTWLRSPHLSTHHPYVEEETVILVKTGHLRASE